MASRLGQPSVIHNGVDIDIFADTVTAAFEHIVAAKPGKTVAAFCHRMVTIQYLRRLMGYSDPHAVRINYCGITRIQASSSTDARSVRSVNETAHLGEALVVSP